MKANNLNNDKYLTYIKLFEYKNKFNRTIEVYRTVDAYDTTCSMCIESKTDEIVFISDDFKNQEVKQVSYVINTIDLTKDIKVDDNAKNHSIHSLNLSLSIFYIVLLISLFLT